jgi:hypothetical protein
MVHIHDPPVGSVEIEQRFGRRSSAVCSGHAPENFTFNPLSTAPELRPGAPQFPFAAAGPLKHGNEETR